MARKATASAPQPHHGTLDDDQLNAIDRAVGNQVRMRRILLGLSQEAVARQLGLTFQQLQKYERGTNRVSGSRLYQLGQILHCPVSYFFKAVDLHDGAAAARGFDEAITDDNPADLTRKRKSDELARAFAAISDERLRNTVFNLVKAAAAA